MNFTVFRFDSIDSTNTEALKQARLGADEGVCVVAGHQTAGRGRHGRVWASPPNSGLYFSVVLRPRIDARLLPLITLTAGIAVYDVLFEFGLKPDIKWVNDVLVGDKKISGILAETTETAKGIAVVVGIGVNLTSSNFPPEIAEVATSVAGESGRTASFAEVEERLLRYFGYWYEILSDPEGPAEILNAWRQRSSYFSGKRVRVQLGKDAVTGVTDGLESDGALRLKIDGGDRLVVQAGDVERLREAETSN
jgi:BirA family transcriptional regulator, biotin operon repressor / biotin---[acetyl-CoA-carboxylase] ligase